MVRVALQSDARPNLVAELKRTRGSDLAGEFVIEIAAEIAVAVAAAALAVEQVVAAARIEPAVAMPVVAVAGAVAAGLVAAAAGLVVEPAAVAAERVVHVRGSVLRAGSSDAMEEPLHPERRHCSGVEPFAAGSFRDVLPGPGPFRSHCPCHFPYRFPLHRPCRFRCHSFAAAVAAADAVGPELALFVAAAVLLLAVVAPLPDLPLVGAGVVVDVDVASTAVDSGDSWPSDLARVPSCHEPAFPCLHLVFEHP